MKVLFFWEPPGLSLEKSNPYGGLLGAAMERLGIGFEAGFAHHLEPSFLEANPIDVLHQNWPSHLYTDPDPAVALERAVRLIDGLSYARSRGSKVVWTMHNLYPHSSHSPDLDRMVRLALTSMADSVIVHCEYGRRQLASHFHRTERVFTIPHGNFMDAYPAKVTRQEARARLGIDPHTFVYLFFGTVRSNKGPEALLQAFSKLPDPDCMLLFAARVASDYGARIVDAAEKADPRIRIIRSSFFANDEFPLFYSAADIAVLPFTEIMTSGSVITALSLGCPVLVPAIGCLPEVVNERIGWLYDPSDPEALLRSMREVRGRDLESCRSAAVDAMRELHWDGIARKTLEAYRA